MYRIHYPILELYMNSIVTQKKTKFFGDSGIVDLRFPVYSHVAYSKV
jgi:hypothetical protein